MIHTHTHTKHQQCCTRCMPIRLAYLPAGKDMFAATAAPAAGGELRAGQHRLVNEALAAAGAREAERRPSHRLLLDQA
eukprot:365482-Chlamydomonas_euryale.AAC.14